jgi:hypothetical protein
MKLVAAVLLLAALAPAQPSDNDLRRGKDGAIRLRALLRNPDNFVLDSVLLAPGKHGNDVCYSFHSRNAFDGMPTSVLRANNGEEVTAADLTTQGKLRIWPRSRGSAFRPCSKNQANATDITKEVLSRLP